MSFSNINTFIEYTGDGATDRFAINFFVLENGLNIVAEVYDVTDPDNPILEVISYSIDHTNYPASEVVFASAPATGRLIRIKRATSIIQTSNFEKGAFPAEAVEETFDLLTMMMQEREADIAVIQSESVDITALQSQVNTNTSDIATNQGDITALQLAVAGIIPATVTEVTASGTVSAVNQGIYIVKSDSVTIQLPTETSGHKVIVKMDGSRVNLIVNSGAGIDGFGANYTLSSNYESVTFVADGSQWYII